MRVEFYKFSGAGNDFIIIDCIKNKPPVNRNKLIKAICSRKFGVGADGFILIKKYLKNSFRMEFYNSDASRAEMCGNGARCAVRFAYIKKYIPQNVSFKIWDKIYNAQVLKENVKIFLNYSITFDSIAKFRIIKQNGYFIKTGVPHFTIIKERIDNIDVNNIGRKIRFHKKFRPEGTNVNFVSVLNNNLFKIRTYERGVEAETLACGTGVIASTIVLASLNKTNSPTFAQTFGGIKLRVDFSKENNIVKNISLTGDAKFICYGNFIFNN